MIGVTFLDIGVDGKARGCKKRNPQYIFNAYNSRVKLWACCLTKKIEIMKVWKGVPKKVTKVAVINGAMEYCTKSSKNIADVGLWFGNRIIMRILLCSEQEK